MDHTYWHKQLPDEPLYPDILWSRPESKNFAGKLAIIGGNLHAFGAPGIAYTEALNSEVGVCKVLLPDAVKKTVRHVLPDASYGPSNPSGSFSKKALDSFLEISNWSDGVILAGDLGRNSETAVLLEQYVQKYSGLLTITQDAADYFKSFPQLLMNRKDTLLVISLAQLQKIFINAPLITPITYSMTMIQLVEALHFFTEKFPLTIAVKHHDSIFVSNNGRVVTCSNTDMPWRIKSATKSSVFWIQNPSKPLEATVTSLYNANSKII
jgi:NAD(P)H-hydrate repair Nnr-like enzyme with NAD(P)H-hydrate dehydratase domain